MTKPTQWDAYDRTAFEADADALGFDLTRHHIPHAVEPWTEYADLNTWMRWGGWIAGRADLLEFTRSLLNPEEFGYAVSKEVRDRARVVLGMKAVEGGEG